MVAEKLSKDFKTISETLRVVLAYEVKALAIHVQQPEL